ncbi:hypothetical protein BH23GEM5_BH23GEM5_07410 [soil metagenome]
MAKPNKWERLAERLRDAIRAGLEVPPDLPAQVTEHAARLRQRAGPDVNPVEIAWRRTRERARKTAAIGAVTTLPAMVPGVGSALAAFGLVADWKYVAEQQRDLVLEIAALLGALPEDPTEDVLALFLAGAGAAFGGKMVGEAAIKLLAERAAKRAFSRVIPGAGAIVAGAVNYGATFAIGRAAISRFAADAGVEVRGLIPARIHPHMAELRNAVLAAVGTASPSWSFSADQRVAIQELSRSEREELLDLAVMSAAAEDGVSAAEHRVLSRMANALGFSPSELGDTLGAVHREQLSRAGRIRTLLGTTRDVGEDVARGVWKRARTLAEDGARRFRREES